MRRWTITISHSTTIIAHLVFLFYLKNLTFWKKISAMEFHNCRSFHKKLRQLCECVWVCDSNSSSSTIVTNFQCTIATIVKYLLSWNIATFETAWLLKCNRIDQWSMTVLRFFWIWIANHIAGLNLRSANGLIYPAYGRQFQAMNVILEFSFSTTLAVQPSPQYKSCDSSILLYTMDL